MRLTAQTITKRLAASFRLLAPQTGGKAMSNERVTNDIAKPSSQSHLPQMTTPHKPNPDPVERVANKPAIPPPLAQKIPNENRLRPQSPLNVLVAEDNYASQLVAKSLLQRGGHSVTTVNDGYEAVKMCLSKSYDIVLMDIEMPKMTGVEATQIIRTTIGPNQNTKIIALTAFGSVSKKFDYLNSGLDDVLCKPLKMTELNSCLIYQPSCVHPSVRPDDLQGSDPDSKSDTEFAGQAALIDKTTITALLNSAGPAHIRALVKVFWQGAYTLLDDIQHAVQHNDPNALSSAAHALKGSAINFGLSQLSKDADCLKDVPPDELINHLENLEQCMTRSRKALGSFINEQDVILF